MEKKKKKNREAWITFVRYVAVTSKTDHQEEAFQQRPAGGPSMAPLFVKDGLF